jgi:hypothetical protein
MNLLVKSTILFFCTLSFNSIASPNCSNLSGCERKFCEVEYQIEKAQQADNQNSVDGLTTALIEAKTNCNDEDLKRELLGKIQDSKEDLAEYMSDFEEAKISGKDSKITKYQGKIEEEQSELDGLLKELSELK